MTLKDLPPYNIVFWCFTKWKRKGVLEEVMDTLQENFVFRLGGKEAQNSALYKTSQHVDKERCVDGNKKVKGRKNLVVVDTPKLPMSVSVHETNIHDGECAESDSSRLVHKFPRLNDGGY